MRTAAVVAGLALAVAAGFSAPLASAENPDTVNQFTAAVNETAAKYGIGPVEVRVTPLRSGQDRGVAEAYYLEYIALSPEWAAKTPEQFAADMNPGHPEGCPVVRGVGIHEVGHMIIHRGTGGKHDAIKAAIQSGQIPRGEIHSPALTPDGTDIYIPEAAAVSFHAVECGSATPMEQQIYDLTYR
jgi:hypothetical protein